MGDEEKALDAVKDAVRDLITDEVIRDMLATLRAVPEDDENRGWAESTIEWLIDDYWGDPDA